MDFVQTLFAVLFFVLYIFCLFTVCGLTFRKGHTLLGILGIFLPFLWLIGAVLPPRPGSPFEMQQAARYRVGAPSPSSEP
jgi:hypothetical protein